MLPPPPLELLVLLELMLALVLLPLLLSLVLLSADAAAAAADAAAVLLLPLLWPLLPSIPCVFIANILYFLSRTRGASKAQTFNCHADEIAVATFVDLNAPWARCGSNTTDLCSAVALINDLNPVLNVTALRMADNPKDSSPRGLYDEEKLLLDQMHIQKQHADTLWIELYTTPSKRSTTRKFGRGRIVVSQDRMDQNIWLPNSELCVSGRAVADETEGSTFTVPASPLPKGTEILQSVSRSPDVDLHLTDRLRPGPEQLASQKGFRGSP
jgi:hypothetical protein